MILIITFNYAVFILYIKEAVNYFFIPFLFHLEIHLEIS